MIFPVFQSMHCNNTKTRTSAEVLARKFVQDRYINPASCADFPSWPAVDRLILRNLITNISEVEQVFSRISINICPETLENPYTFAAWQDLVKSLIESTHLELAIEVTEHIPDALLAKSFDTLKLLDSPIHLDDFGHAHSTLSRLATYPWNACKFDIKLISEGSLKTLTDNEVAINHCINQNIMTVAEQVETAGLAGMAERMSFDFLQGFYIAKPAPLKGPAGDTQFKPITNSQPSAASGELLGNP